MKLVRKGCFETNSSSSHSISVNYGHCDEVYAKKLLAGLANESGVVKVHLSSKSVEGCTESVPAVFKDFIEEKEYEISNDFHFLGNPEGRLTFICLLMLYREVTDSEVGVDSEGYFEADIPEEIKKKNGPGKKLIDIIEKLGYALEITWTPEILDSILDDSWRDFGYLSETFDDEYESVYEQADNYLRSAEKFVFHPYANVKFNTVEY